MVAVAATAVTGVGRGPKRSENLKAERRTGDRPAQGTQQGAYTGRY